MDSELAAAALKCATRGWPVLPLHTVTDAGCSCGRACSGPGKHPRIQRGLHDASTDLTAVARWWDMWPTANVGVRTGREAGVVVLDVDGDEGMMALRELERENSALPRTLSIVTPRGGEHYYFRHPDAEVRNSAGALGPSIDVRGDGGYVLVPPSVGANGRRYELDEHALIAPLPQWLLVRVTQHASHAEGTPPAEWLRVLDGVGAGERNASLARFVGYLLRHYIAVDVAAEITHMVAERFRPPLEPDEVERIIDSIAGREAARRKAARR